MSYKIQQLIRSEIRKLEDKARRKQNEVDKLNKEIKELKEKLEKES